VVALQLQPAAHTGSAPAKEAASDLAIRGTEGVVVTYARCCRPIPGDPILGFLSAGRGITVHTPDCPNVAKFRKHPEQWIDVHWEEHIEGVFPVNVRVEVKNQRGVLAQVAAVIAELDATSTPSVSKSATASTRPSTSPSRCAIACTSPPSCAGCARSSR